MASIVLVHGAWHGAWCWDAVVEHLDRLNVSSTAVELPLVGSAGDVAAARAAIGAAGPGSVVIGHSYGGFVISQAASGVDGLNRLVYLAAFMTEMDEDQGEIMRDSPLLAALTAAGGGMVVDPARAHALFYADSDDATAAGAIARLRPMGFGGEDSAPTEPAWKHVPSTYIICTNDAALPPAAQRTMAAHAETVIEWPTDHSPFLTRPGEIAELLVSYL